MQSKRCDNKLDDDHKRMVEQLSSYDVSDSPIKSVSVFRWGYDYKCFEDFEDYGRKTLAIGLKGVSASQTKRQLYEYVFFRKKALSGVYPNVPFSYIRLLFTELVRGIEGMTKEQTLATMLALFGEYRNHSKTSSHFMCEWITDFCLINNLPLKETGFMQELCPCGFVCERIIYSFLTDYFADNKLCAGDRAELLCHAVGGYNYKHGPAYAIKPDAYDKAIKKCVLAVMDVICEVRGKEFFEPISTQVDRSTFIGLLVDKDSIYRLKIGFSSYTANTEFCAVLREMFKYIENTFRRGFGVKSKIPGVKLPTELKNAVRNVICLDNPECFVQKKRGRKPKSPSEKKQRAKPAYIYDEREKRSSEVEVNIEAAKCLERQSWELARRIGKEYDEDDYIIVDSDGNVEVVKHGNESPENDRPCFDDEWEELAYYLDDDCKTVLRLIADGEDARKFAMSKGALPDAYVTKINEAAKNIIGDILIEFTDRYEVIEDYLEDIEAITETRM